MAKQAKRIRRITFNTPKVAAKLNRHKKIAWTMVAKEQQADLRHTIGKSVIRRRGPKGGIRKIRSKPGQPPRKDTGFLQSHTTVKYEKGKVVIRTPQYGAWLDGGTSRIAPRPWIHSRIRKRAKEWSKVALQKMRTLAGKGPVR